MSRFHLVTDESYHYLWGKSHPHVLEIDPGDRVRFQVREVTSSQLNEKSKSGDAAKLDASKFYPLAGPIHIRGAKVGDALSVDVLKVDTADWGWSAIVPGLGVLEEFTEPYLWIWKLTRKGWVNFKNGLRVKLRPFCGVMGVAPASEGFIDSMAPGTHGGNMDVRHLVAGSKLLLPVWVDGGLFSVGDIHAAQGDGEVCVTAIECPGEVTLRFNLIKNARLDAPRFFTSQERRTEKHYVTTGISPNLMDACKQAIRRMIDDLTEHASLTKEEAYVFCSVAGDLHIHEIVDQPNWLVGFWVSKSSLGPMWRKLA